MNTSNNKELDLNTNKIIHESSIQALIDYNRETIILSGQSHDREIFLYNAGLIITQLYILKEILSDRSLGAFSFFLMSFILIIILAMKSTFYLLKSNRLAKNNSFEILNLTLNSAIYNLRQPKEEGTQEELMRMKKDIEDNNNEISKLFSKSHKKSISALLFLGWQLIILAIIYFLQFLVEKNYLNYLKEIYISGLSILVVLIISLLYYHFVAKKPINTNKK